MAWKVRWVRRALRFTSRLDRPTRVRIHRALEEFAATGRGDVKRLQGVKPETYRLRVGGWRILFSKEPESTLLVRAVRPRGDAY